ncbi:hypothetical protein MTQ12_02580 [Brevibacterium sp. R8603A2]|uniref:hypothetical protein n=1 Tax=Brevibacterium sp. R8603A2 TaxID=2929779 RepID=UPI001FF9E0C8|nr:hypothetical protein [Brevibacterium sp. R8603A2]MCK1801941.1 hypothetical protein [Brevibacterium sp. R8603A2]
MSRTVIVTPFGRPDQLAAACVLSDIPGEVVPIGDFSALVLSGTDIAEGNAAAAELSKLTGQHEVLLLVRNDEQIDAAHYRRGTREADVPAGLALTNLPSELEQLLLETLSPQDIDGWIDTGSMTKLQASAATMTPARAALARTAILWGVVALLAVIAIVVGVIAALSGMTAAWVAAGLGLVVLVLAALRLRSLLAGRTA